MINVIWHNILEFLLLPPQNIQMKFQKLPTWMLEHASRLMDMIFNRHEFKHHRLN